MSELVKVLIEADSEDKGFELCDVFYDQILASFLEKVAASGAVEDARFTL
jgi:hypothetical protein